MDDYRMGESLDDLADYTWACRESVSHFCHQCGGGGRMFRPHKRNIRWKFIQKICRSCGGVVKRRF